MLRLGEGCLDVSVRHIVPLSDNDYLLYQHGRFALTETNFQIDLMYGRKGKRKFNKTAAFVFAHDFLHHVHVDGWYPALQVVPPEKLTLDEIQAHFLTLVEYLKSLYKKTIVAVEPDWKNKERLQRCATNSRQRKVSIFETSMNAICCYSCGRYFWIERMR